VWVTGISVEALDRVVRMLNDRINEIGFKHFKVIRREDHHKGRDLNELVYPDYGLSLCSAKNSDRKSIAIRLEQMRAHVMRASLPAKYKKDQEGNRVKVSSAILYGPPGTGKTSLDEALAFSSHVPLVMLSPSDLIVQGQEQLEARARAVFEALSMMSQVVILLDEFEPILARRGKLGNSKLRNKSREEQVTSEIAQAIREGGKAMVKFLVTGMLPKLVDLHDAAERQSIVYCLATNHLENIDDAAKRGGRFDVHQAIYNPDPLSRAGTFLFRLQPVAKQLSGEQQQFLATGESEKNFAKIVAATVNQSAGELSRRSFKVPKLKEDNNVYSFGVGEEFSFFAHVLKEMPNRTWLNERFAEGKARFADLEKELTVMTASLDDDDKQIGELQWLRDFEACFERRASRSVSVEKCLSESMLEADAKRKKMRDGAKRKKRPSKTKPKKASTQVLE
ncbi:MAG: ATP-binding protein, partial [Acidobacteriota bacterium]|nr:ATP-binding protein [Acidobacteriota bacterium]